MRILIDGDGCPVVNGTIALAREYTLECVIFCDTAHRMERDGARTIVVDKGADSVDFALVNEVHPGDIVVTQDYGLAAMCLGRAAVPIRQDGLVYDDDNIGALLNARHTAKKIRNGGGRIKGPAKRKERENRDFEAALRTLIKNRLTTL